MLDVLANASRPRNKLRPRSPFSDEKNAGNRTSPGWMVWNSALCTCAHTHACRKNRACAFLAGFRVVCCLFFRFPVRNALRASQAVHATDVMVNPTDWQVQKKPRRAFLLWVSHIFVRIFHRNRGDDSNLLIVFYVQIMPDDFVMQLHRFWERQWLCWINQISGKSPP